MKQCELYFKLLQIPAYALASVLLILSFVCTYWMLFDLWVSFWVHIPLDNIYCCMPYLEYIDISVSYFVNLVATQSCIASLQWSSGRDLECGTREW